MKKLIVGITAEGSVGLLTGQLRYFKSKGYQTYLLAPRSERTIAYCENEGCILLPVDIKRDISILSDLKSLMAIIRILIKIKPDIINFGTPKVSLLGLIAARITRIKRRIYTCRGLRYEHEKGMLKQLLMMMERITVFCAQDIICISPSVREAGIRDGIFPRSKCLVINNGSSNGIDLDYFDRVKVLEDERQGLRGSLGFSEKNIVFGFLGRIIDRKGINELYRAFDRIYNELPDARLLVVGPAETSQLNDPGILDKLKNHPGIVWPGRTDKVPLYLSIMDVLVLPAWWEGFGNVLIQAAAMGVPVISTTGTGTIDAVTDGYNGILVPVKDDKRLEEAMHQLYLDDELRIDMGNNGIEWAKNFSNEIIWEGMEELYSKYR